VTTPAVHHGSRRLGAGLLGAVLALAAITPGASAQRLRDSSEIGQRAGVDLVEHSGDRIPGDIELINASGQTVKIGDYFNDGKPAILALVYYDCPVVCSVVMDKLAESLNGLDYVVGKDFRVIVVSFDETETTEQAAARKQHDLESYVHQVTPAVAAGYTFHTATADNIKRLVEADGFELKRLDNGEFSHPVGLTVLSPDGMISRYLYGFSYPPKQVKLALLDASEGKIANSLGDRFLHYCYRYDPTAGAYSVQAMRIMRVGAGVSVLGVGGLIGTLLLIERFRRRRRAKHAEFDHQSTAALGGSS